MQAAFYRIPKSSYGQQRDQQYNDDTAYRQYDGGPYQAERLVNIMLNQEFDSHTQKCSLYKKVQGNDKKGYRKGPEQQSENFYQDRGKRYNRKGKHPEPFITRSVKGDQVQINSDCHTVK